MHWWEALWLDCSLFIVTFIIKFLFGENPLRQQHSHCEIRCLLTSWREEKDTVSGINSVGRFFCLCSLHCLKEQE